MYWVSFKVNRIVKRIIIIFCRWLLLGIEL